MTSLMPHLTASGLLKSIINNDHHKIMQNTTGDLFKTFGNVYKHPGIPRSMFCSEFIEYSPKVVKCVMLVKDV